MRNKKALNLLATGLFAFNAAMAAAPAPVVHSETLKRNDLASPSEACEAMLDYLNNRSNAWSIPHTCLGAYHVTPCPTDADFRATTPPSPTSQTLNRVAQGFYNYGNEYCQPGPSPMNWSLYAACPRPFIYLGPGTCRCPANEVESGGQCVLRCPPGQRPVQGSCTAPRTKKAS